MYCIYVYGNESIAGKYIEHERKGYGYVHSITGWDSFNNKKKILVKILIKNLNLFFLLYLIFNQK